MVFLSGVRECPECGFEVQPTGDRLQPNFSRRNGLPRRIDQRTPIELLVVELFVDNANQLRTGQRPWGQQSCKRFTRLTHGTETPNAKSLLHVSTSFGTLCAFAFETYRQRTWKWLSS